MLDLLSDTAAVTRRADPRTPVLILDGALGLSDCAVEPLRSAGVAFALEPDLARASARVGSGQHDLVLVDATVGDVFGHLSRGAHVLAVIPPHASRTRLAELLDAGADDCLVFPFEPVELVARVRALLRRGSRAHPVLSFGGVAIDVERRDVKVSGKGVTLTRYEFSLLLALAEHAGRVLSRDELMEQAKGSTDAAFDRSIDVHICRLRTKLGDDPRQPRLLRTVRGQGYLLVADP